MSTNTSTKKTASAAQAAAALAEAIQAAEKIPSAIDRARSDLTSDITHDLREEMTRVGRAIFQAIEIAQKRGAATLQAAGADLDRAARARDEAAKATTQSPRISATAANQPSPLAIYVAAVLAFMAGASFAWLVTPTQHIRQVYRYDYQISRAAAPRIAIDPGAAGIPGLSKRPVFIGPAALAIPRLQPKQQPKKGGDHE